MNASDYINVIPTSQEIACLITKQDFEEIDLEQVQETVIIPGRCFIHDLVAEEVLQRDGKKRLIHRGPDTLTMDGEMSGTLSKQDILKHELIAFEDLIELINFMGVHI